jgi:hypothetical protein
MVQFIKTTHINSGRNCSFKKRCKNGKWRFAYTSSEKTPKKDEETKVEIK